MIAHNLAQNVAHNRARRLWLTAVISLFALIALDMLWESILSPVKPGGSWLILKVVPLFFVLKGVVKRDVYTMQWGAMLILLYFTEGVVRASSDLQTSSVELACMEILLSLIFFLASLGYLAPIKKAAKNKIKEQNSQAT